MDFQNRKNDGNMFVCPNDRQLALRAKLRTGWSTGRPACSLRADEQAAIISVIRRNEDIESAERIRIGRLVERVEKIKLRAAECGPNCCRLCGESFGFLGPTKLMCVDCRKPVCSKCSIDLEQKARNRDISLCKICLETRDMWKKSGAWFYKGLPQYEIPTKSLSVKTSIRKAPAKLFKTTHFGIPAEDSSSDEDGDITDKSNNFSQFQRENSFRLRTVGSFRSFFNGEKKNSNSIFFNRQASKSESNQDEWETVSTTSGALRRESSQMRRGSISSSWSVSEYSPGNSAGMTHFNQMCQEPLLGWLEVTVNYSEMHHTLECMVLRARDLPPMDSAGLADPFCKMNIITPEGTAKQTRWMRIKTVHKTRNPEFNESITFLGVEPAELGNSLLYIVVLDDDKYGHDFLGAVKIGLSTLHSTSPRRMTIPLGPEDQHSIQAALAGPWSRGQILISLCYNTKKRALIVIVKKCNNLLPMDNNGYSDPFVKLQLRPDPHKKKFKTNVKWRNLNPVFNEEFQFETRPNDLDKQCLIITVWDKDLGKSNDFLGSLVLGHNSKGRRLKQWTDCVRLPDHFHEHLHCLSSDLMSR